MVNSLILMFSIQTAAHLIINHINPISFATLGYLTMPGDLTNKMILQINLSALMVCIAMSAVCFMFSGIFNQSKYAIGCAGTFVGVSILANMLAMFGKLGVDGLDKFKYLTICTFYDYQSIIFSDNDWIVKMVYPIVIALVAYGVGELVFKKKDLPL